MSRLEDLADEASAESAALYALHEAQDALNDWENGGAALGATLSRLAQAGATGERVLLKRAWQFLWRTSTVEAHGFRGGDLTSCARCGMPIQAVVHGRSPW